MRANPAHIALKIAVASAPSVDLLALFEKITPAAAEDHFDRIKLGELEALRVQKTYSDHQAAQTITAIIHALIGQTHHQAVQEVLLSHADGILLIIDLEPLQYQSNMQVMLHTAQTLLHQGSAPEETPMVFLYMGGASASTELIQQWDQLLEIERNAWTRLMLSSDDTQPLLDAIDLLTGKIISLPRLRVIA
jgi:hypothetical protein